MGYDISDYMDIDPLYGSLSDVDELIRELHSRNMKLMMDLVVNHTSDQRDQTWSKLSGDRITNGLQHAWFKESRSSLDNPKRDWYIWKKPKIDENGQPQPPNNWSMLLGEANSAWTYDEKTGEYYLALFTSEQPDLNWENPAVRKAVHDILRFWLDRGASGFRMDVINLISKDQRFPDAPVVAPEHKYQPGYKYYANGPRLHEYLHEIYTEVLSKYDTITVGEMPWARDQEDIIRVVGANAEELNMIFIFELVDIDDEWGRFRLTLRHYEPYEIKQIQTRYQRMMIDRDGWNSVFCENHDNPRSVTRYADDSDEFRVVSAKLLCLMETFLCGTLYIYQGQEIGMRNVPLEWDPEEYKDIETQNYWKKMTDMWPGNKQKLDFARKIMQHKARDNARTPMQWSSQPNAGFCKDSIKPWMRVNDDYTIVNVDAQRASENSEDLSVLQFWKEALAIRKADTATFIYGDYQLLNDDKSPIFAYKRTSESNSAIVILNLSGTAQKWSLPEKLEVEQWKLGSYGSKPKQPMTGQLELRPWEGLLGEIKPS
ncbi:MAG: hypothetical protein M1822_007839 [Bathelium mastoideum]|nr:MAG: hypothetical protein M1822_007839 [Bathelium mastoideum]